MLYSRRNVSVPNNPPAGGLREYKTVAFAEITDSSARECKIDAE